ncbi:MAG: HK97 gp10 family phage protein [Clostridia bacterium]|nr:HK97 gp10 family phage protein [Clostridia bacterium]
MGAFATGGIAAEMEKFEKLARGSEESCRKAVKAGGKLLAEKLSDAAPIRTGGLAASIKAGAVKYSAADGYYCEVAPTGTNADGENYAKIGNILEYGRSNMPARPWFAPTVDNAADEVNSTIRDVFQAAQGEG